MNRQVPSVGAVEGTVVAEEFIRAECHSQVVHLDHRRLSQLHPTHFKVVTRKNEIVSSPLTSAWPLSMEVATECRMQNVECTLVSGGTNGSTTATGSSLSLLFSTTRPVEKGQRLHFWFSETMLAQLEMPFLVPRNIQGGDRYVCHKCGSVFATPNPLKLHLFFHCGHRTVSLPALWVRVHHVLTKPPIPSPYIGSGFSKHSNPIATALALPHHHLPSFRPGTTPAQVETLVSHLGRSKHGHVCIYCGKVYSRKYGLKIHIRTHTGYKPLKCPVCSRPFGDPSNLNKHIRLHSEHHQNGDTPYKCELCGKVMVRRRDLDRHIQSRHSSGSSSSGQPSDSTECPSSPLSSDDTSSGHQTASSSPEDSDDQLDVIDIC